MQDAFDSVAFIRRIGERLVEEVGRAREATTPALVGQAVEQSVREQLEQILPRGISVGQGCVIDSWGNTSRQMDIVLYERDICPVFQINNTPQATYYPCEGVIAVGEVKSVLKINGLRDGFEKVKSVKALQRYWTTPKEEQQARNREVYFRKYGSLVGTVGIEHEDKDKEAETKEIFGFIVGGRAEIGMERLLEEFAGQGVAAKSTSPNALIVLNRGWLQCCNIQVQEGRMQSAEYAASLRTGKHVAFSETAFGFNQLVAVLYFVYRRNVTSEVTAFEQYIKDAREGPVQTFARELKVTREEE